MTGFWRPLGYTLTALTVLVSGVSLWSWLARQTVTEEHTYRGAIAGVAIDLDDGSATVSAGPAGQVRVRRQLTWSAGRPTIREEHDGDLLRISAGCDASPRLPGCSVDYRIEVPPTVTVTARTGSGAVSVHDVTGALSLHTRNGDITVSAAAGEVTAEATSGRITAVGLRSPTVAATSRSGGVHLRFAAPPEAVRARVGSGPVEIVVPPGEGYNLHASTESGARTVSVREDPAAARVIDVETGDGDVRVRYAAAPGPGGHDPGEDRDPHP